MTSQFIWEVFQSCLNLKAPTFHLKNSALQDSYRFLIRIANLFRNYLSCTINNSCYNKSTAKQTVHLTLCNWLPFYRSCSFASQIFIQFADFLIIAFKIIQKKLILLYPLTPLCTRKTSGLRQPNSGEIYRKVGRADCRNDFSNPQNFFLFFCQILRITFLKKL